MKLRSIKKKTLTFVLAMSLCAGGSFTVLAAEESAAEVQEEQEPVGMAEEPAPAPVVEEPAPAPVVEEPAPAPVVEEPAPAPVVEEPAPAPVVEEPAPAPVVEEPAPAPVVEEPAPVVEEPAPAPVVEEPAPATEEPAPTAVQAAGEEDSAVTGEDDVDTSLPEEIKEGSAQIAEQITGGTNTAGQEVFKNDAPASEENKDSRNAIQKAVDVALKSAKEKAGITDITIVVDDGEYDGDINISWGFGQNSGFI